MLEGDAATLAATVAELAAVRAPAEVAEPAETVPGESEIGSDSAADRIAS